MLAYIAAMSTLPLSAESGRAAAFVVYILYLLSIPSAGVLALAGVLVALLCQHGANGVSLAHLRDQVRIWGIAFIWGVVIFAVTLLGAASFVDEGGFIQNFLLELIDPVENGEPALLDRDHAETKFRAKFGIGLALESGVQEFLLRRTKA